MWQVLRRHVFKTLSYNCLIRYFSCAIGMELGRVPSDTGYLNGEGLSKCGFIEGCSDQVFISSIELQHPFKSNNT